ncbi:hypothetical protein AMJ50_00095 [Parcubacteria bacterium DG_74_3]|nr:MAG: hypothetical protein AMJ50_00095 [Parcubacteria bacterium DG_74_3]
MIEINNLTSIALDENFFKKTAQKVFEGEKKKNIYLSIALVEPNRMRKINREYRGKNRVTDVLSFSEPNLFQKQLKKDPLLKAWNLGEIIICPREVKKNAKRFSSTFEKELTLCLIHGILHLLGYEHEKSEKKAELMARKQKNYLSQIFE